MRDLFAELRGNREEIGKLTDTMSELKRLENYQREILETMRVLLDRQRRE